MTMGEYNDNEVCELFGIFILFQLSCKYNKNCIGIYRDDSLTIFKNICGPLTEKIKKIFHLWKISFQLVDGQDVMLKKL